MVNMSDSTSYRQRGALCTLFSLAVMVLVALAAGKLSLLGSNSKTGNSSQSGVYLPSLLTLTEQSWPGIFLGWVTLLCVLSLLRVDMSLDLQLGRICYQAVGTLST